jgi:hypothetical protein
VHEVARHLRAPGHGLLTQRRESAARGVAEEEGRRGAGLHLGEAPVDRVAVEPRRRAGLETAQLEAEAAQRVRERRCRGLAGPAGGKGALAADAAAVEGGPGAQHDGAAAQRLARGEAHTLDTAHLARAAGEQVGHQPTAQFQPLLLGQHARHGRVVGVLIGLGAQGLHRGALARVEHADLDERLVDDAAHGSTQRIDLAHQVPLGRAADRGVAGHQRHVLRVHRQHQRARTDACRCQRRLAAGVPRANNDDVVSLHSHKHTELRHHSVPRARLIQILLRDLADRQILADQVVKVDGLQRAHLQCSERGTPLFNLPALARRAALQGLDIRSLRVRPR